MVDQIRCEGRRLPRVGSLTCPFNDLTEERLDQFWPRSV